MAKNAAVVYSVGLCYGLCYASVCAPGDMSAEVVEHSVNAEHPTGLSHGWRIADEPFASGSPNPNPSPCNDNSERRHWLLSC
jgi:hypothetical protein